MKSKRLSQISGRTKKSSKDVDSIAKNRKKRVHKKLTSHSEKQRKHELELSTVSKAPTTKITVKGRLNQSGNKRGLHLTPEKAAQIRGHRKIFNKRTPPLQCSNCQFSSVCPDYRAGYECAYMPMLRSHSVDSMDDLIEYARELVGANMQRTHLELIMERMTGGKPSLETSESIEKMFSQVINLFKLEQESQPEVQLEADGASLVDQLFGGLENLIDSTDSAMDNPTELKALPVPIEETEIVVSDESIQVELVNDYQAHQET